MRLRHREHFLLLSRQEPVAYANRLTTLADIGQP
jgi:hypothetical protein